MKFKRKLVSMLGATAMVIPLALSMTSCTFTKKQEEPDPQPDTPTPKEEYACPSVTFDGNPIMSPEKMGTLYSLSGFSFSRKLYEGEVVTPIVHIIGENASTLTPAAKFSAKTDNMSIQFVLSNFGDKYLSHTVRFTLTFNFKYKNDTKSYNDLATEFEFRYTPSWRPNSILGSLGKYEAIWDTDGKVRFKISEETETAQPLYLERNLESDESIEITTSDGIVFESKEIVPVDVNNETKYRLDMIFTIPNQDRYETCDKDFSITFTFKAEGLTTTDPTTLYSGNVIYGRDKTFNITYQPQANTISTSPGETTFNFSNTDFKMSREVKPKYGEVLTMYATDAKTAEGDPTPSTKYTFSATKTNTAILNPSLTYNISSEDIYKKHSPEAVYIYWKLEGTDNVWSKSGYIDLNYQFNPKWIQKSALFQPGSATQEEGVWQINILEEGQTVKGKQDMDINCGANLTGFYVDGLLSDNERINVSLTDINGNPSDSLEILNKNNAVTILGKDETPGHEKTYLGVKVGYKTDWLTATPSDDDRARLYKSQKEQFKLNFTFKLSNDESFSFESKVDDKLALVYTPKDYVAENGLIPSLNDKYNGKQAGDTLLTVTGKFDNRAFDSTKDQLDVPAGKQHAVELTENPDDISIVYGAAGSQYEQGIEVKSGSSSFSMYIQLPSFDDPADYSEVHTYSLKAVIHLKNYDESQGQWIAYDRDIQTTLVYTPFSEDVEDYIKLRTVPMVMYNKESEDSYQNFYFTAWLAGDATPDNTDDYTYYLVTSYNNYQMFKQMLSDHSAQDSFRFGVTDDEFASEYLYSNISLSSTPGTDDWNSRKASLYKNNYLFCDYTYLDWQVVPSYETSGSTTYGANFAVAKLEFNSDFFEDEKGYKVDRPEWEAAYWNKLTQINNYEKRWGHINAFVRDPIANDGWSNYSEYGIGAWDSAQFNHVKSNDPEFVADDEYWTTSAWTYTSLKNSTINFMSSADMKNNKDKIASSTYDSTNVYYLSNETWSRGRSSKWSGSWHNSNYYNNVGLNGGMLVVKDENATGTTPPLQVAGMFRGWLNMISISGWTGNITINGNYSGNSTYTPYFNIFSGPYGGNYKNVLEYTVPGSSTILHYIN